MGRRTGFGELFNLIPEICILSKWSKSYEGSTSWSEFSQLLWYFSKIQSTQGIFTWFDRQALKKYLIWYQKFVCWVNGPKVIKFLLADLNLVNTFGIFPKFRLHNGFLHGLTDRLWRTIKSDTWILYVE